MMPVPAREERKRVSRANPMDVNAVEGGARRAARPSAAQQHNLVPFRRESPKNFVQMNFRAARKRILSALPIDNRNA